MGIVNLPLHGGRAPRWLFERMKKLGKSISQIIIDEYGIDEFLERFADPFWFQSFSCVLGYDWHSSGTTTVTMGAMKEVLKDGIAVVGGKGRVALRTPEEIEKVGDKFGLSESKISKLKEVSKMVAKVDNSCVQDGFRLYHHTMIITEKGKWVVIQQGMNGRWARRYHWIYKTRSFVDEPHSGIASEIKVKTLDLTSKENRWVREKAIDSVYELPRRHDIIKEDLNVRILKRIEEINPKNFEELIKIRGIGPKTLRAIALVSEIIYGNKLSWKDPATYSFAHGGKDGIPYPVNKKLYDKSIEILEQAIREIDDRKALKRLHDFINR